jgi:hypothetical protein
MKSEDAACGDKGYPALDDPSAGNAGDAERSLR